MSRVKNLYWNDILEQQDNNDNELKEMSEALYYQSTIWNVVDVINRYGFQTVMFDVVAEMQRKEVK